MFWKAERRRGVRRTAVAFQRTIDRAAFGGCFLRCRVAAAQEKIADDEQYTRQNEQQSRIEAQRQLF